MNYVISGIQQVGIGVSNAEEAWRWYRIHFGFDVPIFKDSATASLMKQYTGGIAQTRYAILAMNMQGGGGLEIWQYTSRNPQGPARPVAIGDTGILAVKLKTRSVKLAFSFLKREGVRVLSEPIKSPNGRSSFFIQDPYGNFFQIMESTDWFSRGNHPIGGVMGFIIGVSDLKHSESFLSPLLQHKTIFRSEGVFSDLQLLSTNGEESVSRLLLRSTNPHQGAFGRLLGETELELIQSGETPLPVFKDRLWGDLGFIHACFDVRGMACLKENATKLGVPFTVDSADSFEMGNAAGRFSYVENQDGTLFEFVETHKIPVVEKLGLSIDIRHRAMHKPLPDWMLKLLSLKRIKDR